MTGKPKTYKVIDVDFDVYKALVALLRDENDTFNDVLKRTVATNANSEPIEKCD